MVQDVWKSLSIQNYSAAQFLVSLVLLIAATPLLGDLPRGDLVEAVLLSLVLLAAVPATGGNGRTIAAAVFLALPALAGKWLHQLFPEQVPPQLFLAAGSCFLVFAIVLHLRFILLAGDVNVHVLCAGVTTFLMLGLAWCFSYLLLESMDPASFRYDADLETGNRVHGFWAMYYSLANMSGMAVSEVSPTSNVARMLALLQAITATFYLTILVARLVALHTARLGTVPENDCRPNDSGSVAT